MKVPGVSGITTDPDGKTDTLPATWATDLDAAAAGALAEWGDVWVLHGNGATDNQVEAVRSARAAASPIYGPAAWPQEAAILGANNPRP